MVHLKKDFVKFRFRDSILVSFYGAEPSHPLTHFIIAAERALQARFHHENEGAA